MGSESPSRATAVRFSPGEKPKFALHGQFCLIFSVTHKHTTVAEIDEEQQEQETTPVFSHQRGGLRAALFRRGTHHCHAGRRRRGEAGMRQRASPQRQPQQNKSGCPVLPSLFLSLNNHHTNAAQVTVTAGRDGACQRSQYTTLIHPAHTHTQTHMREGETPSSAG